MNTNLNTNTNTNTFIKNVGYSKTFINNNNKSFSNQMQWEGDYNGNIAKLNLDINDNGKKDSLHLELNNEDLLNILNTKSINKPIHERLEIDYLTKKLYPNLNKIKAKTNSKSKTSKSYKNKTRSKLHIKNKDKNKKKSLKKK
jgi:hypothetical protein